MDAHDIFKKLTAGVRFKSKNQLKTKNITKSSQVKNEFEENAVEIKDEFDENHTSNNTSDYETDHGISYLKGNAESNVQEKKKKKSSKSSRKLKEIEEINRLRNLNRIHVIGSKVPAPMCSFAELETKFRVQKKVLKSIASSGYCEPTPIQMQSIPIMMEGRALMACAPTGSGKTLAFLVPIIRDLREPQRKGFRALIVCPTRELAKQTLRECLRLSENIGLKVHILSKVNEAEQKYGPKSNKKYDILISTPNRICYLLRSDPPLLDLKNVEWLIIDEADKLMEDGAKGFKDQFDEIFSACSSESKKVALFSATHTVNVAKWASRNLKKLTRVVIGERNAATDLVEQSLLFVGSESGKLLAFRDLVKKGLDPPVLVFVQSKDRAKQLFGELIYDGVNVDVIHADRTQQQRDNVVKAFREGKIWVLICTDLMGRGIDFKGINLVINYDFPPDPISYVHRVGRAGRAGRPGKAITFFTQEDTNKLRSIAHIIKNSGGTVPEYMLTLKKIKKSEKKKMKNAPEREDITTIPKFVLEKRARLKKLWKLKKQKNEGKANGHDLKKDNKDKMRKNKEKMESKKGLGKHKIKPMKQK